MSLKPIRNEEDYQKAVRLNLILKDSEPGIERNDMLKINTILMENYQNKQIPQNFYDPIETIKYYYIHNGHTETDLYDILGKDTQAILNKEKFLTKAMIWHFCRQWKIPAALMIQDYSLINQSEITLHHS